LFLLKGYQLKKEALFFEKLGDRVEREVYNLIYCEQVHT